ncbi:MAG: hypothetical protein GXX95_02090 [Methanomassiliicoccus sp.]|nr:hypothetical protein [Methanomassiliicoccus sp.]
MYSFRAICMGLTLMLLMSLPYVAAHSPVFSGGNDGLDRAMEVDDPTKSWAIYNTLPEGGMAHYYRLEMKQGEGIVLSLISPQVSVEKGFLPSVAILGKGLGSNDTLPSFVDRPTDDDALLVKGDPSSTIEFEPFTPAAFHEIAKVTVDAPADGTYYIAVFDENVGGNYGLAVGTRETFTAEEWLLIPFVSFRTYQWEGQTTLSILAPSIIAFFVSFGYAAWTSRRRDVPMDGLWLMTVISGSLMVATAASILYQMTWGLSKVGWVNFALVSIMFAVIPLFLGLMIIRIGLRDSRARPLTHRTRLALLLIGAVGLLFWAGWIAGPILAIISAFFPRRWMKRDHSDA